MRTPTKIEFYLVIRTDYPKLLKLIIKLDQYKFAQIHMCLIYDARKLL